ncbi:hypothetical protein SDC9_157028 [bioreactor metagenome]|uniref:Uncharacterized protein n=1 Tax=bioreactor metagenome TaxID=1076179 RepID=A0A645F7X6_9ZZZZ
MSRFHPQRQQTHRLLPGPVHEGLGFFAGRREQGVSLLGQRALGEEAFGALAQVQLGLRVEPGRETVPAHGIQAVYGPAVVPGYGKAQKLQREHLFFPLSLSAIPFFQPSGPGGGMVDGAPQPPPLLLGRLQQIALKQAAGLAQVVKQAGQPPQVLQPRRAQTLPAAFGHSPAVLAERLPPPGVLRVCSGIQHHDVLSLLFRQDGQPAPAADLGHRSARSSPPSGPCPMGKGPFL